MNFNTSGKEFQRKFLNKSLNYDFHKTGKFNQIKKKTHISRVDIFESP